jgi:hypothetical protein
MVFNATFNNISPHKTTDLSQVTDKQDEEETESKS